MKCTVPFFIDACNFHCDRWDPRSQLIIVDATGFQLALKLISSSSQLHVKPRGSCLRDINQIQNAFSDPKVYGFDSLNQSLQTKWLTDETDWPWVMVELVSLQARIMLNLFYIFSRDSLDICPRLSTYCPSLLSVKSYAKVFIKYCLWRKRSNA